MRRLMPVEVLPKELQEFVLDYLPLSLENELKKYMQLLDDANDNETKTADHRALFTYAFTRNMPPDEQDHLEYFLENNPECIEMLASILSNKILPIAGAGCWGYLLKDRFFDAFFPKYTALSGEQAALIRLLLNPTRSQEVREEMTVNTCALAYGTLLATLGILLFGTLCGVLIGGLPALSIFYAINFKPQNFPKLFYSVTGICALLTIAILAYWQLKNRIQSPSAVKKADENYHALYKLFSFTETMRQVPTPVSPETLPSRNREDAEAPLLVFSR